MCHMRKCFASSTSSCRRLRPDLTLAFKIFKGEAHLNPSDFFTRPPRAGLRGHTCRLLQGPSRLRRRSGAFLVWFVKYWNRLPAPLALSPSVPIFKKQLDRQWLCSTCVNTVPLHRNFSQYCNPRLFMLHLPTCTAVVIAGPCGHSYH